MLGLKVCSCRLEGQRAKAGPVTLALTAQAVVPCLQRHGMGAPTGCAATFKAVHCCAHNTLRKFAGQVSGRLRIKHSIADRVESRARLSNESLILNESIDDSSSV